MLGQERERLVERRQLRGDLPQLLERALATLPAAAPWLTSASRSSARARAARPRGRARRTRSRRRRTRARPRTSAACSRARAPLRRGARRAATRRLPASSLTGAVGRKSSSSSPPRAAYSTIIRSVTHSTGARSSVQGRFAFVGHRPQLAEHELAERPQLRRPVRDELLCERGPAIVEAEQDLVEAQRRPDRHRVELVREGAGDPVEQALVAGHRRHVEREDPARLEPLPRQPEELPRREIERHVGLVVRVDDDQVVALVRAAEERPRIGVVHGQARVVLQPEEAAADAADRRIELDPVDPGRRVEDAERAGGRAGRVAEDRDGAQRPVEERRQRQERVPDAAGEHRVGAPDGVDGDPLVQAQQPPAVGTLDDLDELVERVLLVQQARAPP